MKHCVDCGQQFESSLNACPNCGCPADVCTELNVITSNGVIAVAQPQKIDRAHYVYECACIFWHTFNNKYAKFYGRATRREFWSFIFVPLVVSLFCAFLSPIVFIFTLIPTLAVMVRRLHDGNHTGWWCCVPFVAIFFYLQRSDVGENLYGVPDDDLGI